MLNQRRIVSLGSEPLTSTKGLPSQSLVYMLVLFIIKDIFKFRFQFLYAVGHGDDGAVAVRSSVLVHCSFYLYPKDIKMRNILDDVG